jgi:hypothetical protein
MYAPPPVVVPVARQRTGILGAGPILAIACLLFLLLIIASVIILSLIPVYTPRRAGSTSGNSQVYFIILNYNGTLGSDGTLSQSALNSIARAIEQARGLPTGSIVAVSGSASSTAVAGKRKRRASQVSRSRRGILNGFSQLIYFFFVFNLLLCRICIISVAQRFLNLTFVVQIIFFGTFQTLNCIIQSIGAGFVSVPPFLLTSTTAAASTTTAPSG